MSMFGRNGKTPVEKDTRHIDFDPRPPEVRAADNAIDALRHRAMEEGPMEPDYSVSVLEEINRRLNILMAERETTNKGIAAIKQIVATLTYGEMTEMCGQIASHMAQVDEQNAKDAIVSVLPQTMHRWATS